MDSHLWWHLARASGLTAWVLLSATVLWGLFLSTRVLGGRVAPAWLLDLHRGLGALTVVFTAVHMVGLGLDEWIAYGPTELFIPLTSTFRPWAVAWGIVAMYLLIAIAITSWIRRWIPDLVWRWVHRTAFVCFVLATAHTLTAGTDRQSPYVVIAAITFACVFVFLCVYRLLAGRRTPPVSHAAHTESRPAAEVDRHARGTFHRLRVADVRRETAESVSVQLDVPASLVPEFAWRPGQFLTLRADVGGTEVRRSYSICSGAADGELRIAVKRVPGGRMSSWVVDALQPGAFVDVARPAGRFTTDLNPLRSRLVLGIVAGSGITPVLSILRSILALEPHSRCVLVAGNRDADQVMLGGELERLLARHPDRFQVHHVYSRTTLRLSGATLLDLPLGITLADLDDVFLCGPNALVDDLRTVLVSVGLDRSRVHSESFATTTSAPAARNDESAQSGEVTLVIDGVATRVDVAATETILDAGLRAGVDIPYSCMAGSCGSCLTRVLDGDIQGGDEDLTDAERRDGMVYACQARIHQTSSERAVSHAQ